MSALRVMPGFAFLVGLAPPVLAHEGETPHTHAEAILAALAIAAVFALVVWFTLKRRQEKRHDQ